MKCSKCHTDNPSDSKYCKKCAAPLFTSEDTHVSETRTFQAPIKDVNVGEIIADKYKLLEELGRGGMGAVYKAEQIKPLKRSVALKIIKLGMDTSQVVARFESERQALAVMDHPNIAKVFDAGATGTGRPYFVMELVRGVSLTEYCDKYKLTTRERLELFTSVCQAVQHAHQKGVIHRDLKPSNILVTVQKNEPVPKIIDFGIAKATELRLTERTLFTEQGQLMGTPEYMSPEQAEMSGLDVDTRTDIYSLGVMLYELLAGVLPFDPKTLRSAGFSEIQRIIRETEPPKASTRLSGLGDKQTTIAEHRKTDPGSLQRQLKGDLDWITMKALAKDRIHRYASASELATDIERYLRNEPIMAGPPSPVYRLKKYIRRHKVGVAAAAVVILAILIGVAGTTVGLLRAIRAEKKAVEEANTAQQVSDFLVRLFEVSNPGEARGNTITAREILSKGAGEIEQGLKDQPLTRASLMETIGTVYRKLGLYKDAEPLLKESLKIRENLLGSKDARVADSLYSLALLHDNQGKFKEAKELTQRSLEIWESELGPTHPKIAKGLHEQGLLHYKDGKFKEAETIFERALEIREKALGSNHPDVAESLFSLGVVNYIQSRFDESEYFYKRALEIRETVLGPDHPDVAQSLNSLAALYHWLRRYDEAESLYNRSLAIRKKTLGQIHPEVAGTLDNIGILYHYKGNLVEAEKYYKEALEIRKKSLGENHPDVGASYFGIASLYHGMGRYEEAAQAYEQAIKILEISLGEEHLELPPVMHNLALLYSEMGRNDEAEALHKRGLKIREKGWGPKHVGVTQSLRDLGYFYTTTGRYTEAEPLFRRALSLVEKEWGPDHIRVAEALRYLGQMFSLKGENKEAEQHLRRALDICKKESEPDSEVVAGVCYYLAYLYHHNLNRFEEAEELYKQALTLQEENLGSDSTEVKEIIKEYANLLRQMDRKEEAAKLEFRIK